MSVRIHNPARWAPIEPGKALRLAGFPRRLIKVSFNPEVPGAAIMLTDSDGVTVFLATLSKLDTVEFYAGVDRRGAEVVPDILVTPTSEGVVWYDTHDGEDPATFDNAQLVPFVEIAIRRERNPQLEMMMYLQKQNAERMQVRLKAASDSIEAKLRELENARKVATGDAGGVGASAGGGGAPAGSGAAASADGADGGEPAGSSAAKSKATKAVPANGNAKG